MHSRALDGIRGLAIAAVVLHNLGQIHASSGVFGDALQRVAALGWVGVTLFFVLSGFLITRGLLLLQSSPAYFQTFFARRALRIFPLYYVTLAFFFWILPLLTVPPQPIQDDLSHQIWYWLYLTNWTQHSGLGGMSLPHFWSLAVEEQFYLAWPFILWRRSPAQVLRICGGLIVLSLVSRVVLTLLETDPMNIYTFTICRMDALAMGAAAAVWLHDRRLAPNAIFNWRTMLLTAAGVLLLGRVLPKAYGMVDPMGQIVGYPLFGIAFTALLLAALAAEADTRTKWVRSLHWTPLRALGKYSYAIYIFHVPLHGLVGVPLLQHFGFPERLAMPHMVGYLIVHAAAVFALAWVSYHAFEVHFLRLKDRVSAPPAPDEAAADVSSRLELDPNRSATPLPADEK